MAHQAPLSMEFSRQEYWSGLPFPTPGDLSNPGIEPVSPASPALQADSLPLNHLGSTHSPIPCSFYNAMNVNCQWAGDQLTGIRTTDTKVESCGLEPGLWLVWGVGELLGTKEGECIRGRDLPDKKVILNC